MNQRSSVTATIPILLIRLSTERSLRKLVQTRMHVSDTAQIGGYFAQVRKDSVALRHDLPVRPRAQAARVRGRPRDQVDHTILALLRGVKRHGLSALGNFHVRNRVADFERARGDVIRHLRARGG